MHEALASAAVFFPFFFFFLRTACVSFEYTNWRQTGDLRWLCPWLFSLTPYIMQCAFLIEGRKSDYGVVSFFSCSWTVFILLLCWLLESSAGMNGQWSPDRNGEEVGFLCLDEGHSHSGSQSWEALLGDCKTSQLTIHSAHTNGDVPMVNYSLFVAMFLLLVWDFGIMWPRWSWNKTQTN